MQTNGSFGQCCQSLVKKRRQGREVFAVIIHIIKRLLVILFGLFSFCGIILSTLVSFVDVSTGICTGMICGVGLGMSIVLWIEL
jgi:hypothetical protein